MTAPPVTDRHPYRWVVLLLSWAAFTLTAVDRGTWGPAALAVGTRLGVALAGLGAFATAYYVGYVISNAGGGLLTDRFGARRVMGVSLILAGAGMVAFGQVTTPAVGIAVQCVIGLFAGADYASGVSLITRWFPARDRGFAFGVFLTATSLGVVVANAVVPTLVRDVSWNSSYRLFGVVSVVVGVACLVLLPRRPGPVAPSEPPEPPGAGAAAGRWRVPARRDLLLLALAGFGGLWGTYGFATWANSLMVRGQHVDPVRAGIVVVVFGVAALAAKPAIGLLTDVLGGRRRIACVVVLALFVVALLAFGAMRSETGFLLVAPFLGVAAYAYSPLQGALIPVLSGTAVVGSAAGLMNAVWQLGSTIVPIAVGAVYAATGSFPAAFGVLAAGPLLGAVAMLAVREPAPRPSGSAAPAGQKSSGSS